YLILDRRRRIIAVLAGRPKDREGRDPSEHWAAVASRTAAAFEKARVDHPKALKAKDLKHRRGQFAAVASGVSYGGGQTRPGNLQHSAATNAMLAELLANPDLGRIAGHQSAALAAYFPKPYAHMCNGVGALHQRQPELVANFRNSAYPTATFNLGPNTICFSHRDSANYPTLPCAITALGDFDPDVGGHLYLWDLGLKIRFPPGSTILLPSAGIRHGNVPIQRGEHRFSFTQYCSGGLLRWVRHGFRPARSMSPAERRKLEGDPDSLWKEQLARLSTPESLVEDRRWLCEVERARAAARKAG
ncbi:hypothetical protein BV25DRAFT_1939900, partial [Artomyces pyxidatus]